jgi:limonene-1,2-epoxide hydrolase
VVSSDLIQEYGEAWLEHVAIDDSPAGQEKLRRLVAFYADDVVYEDVPTGHTFAGREGVAQMSTFVSSQYDVTLALVSAQSDGERFALEYESDMVFGGDTVHGRGVAVGTIGADGKITSHRDYYDSRPIAAAAGAAQAEAGAQS